MCLYYRPCPLREEFSYRKEVAEYNTSEYLHARTYVRTFCFCRVVLYAETYACPFVRAGLAARVIKYHRKARKSHITRNIVIEHGEPTTRVEMRLPVAGVPAREEIRRRRRKIRIYIIIVIVRALA